MGNNNMMSNKQKQIIRILLLNVIGIILLHPLFKGYMPTMKENIDNKHPTFTFSDRGCILIKDNSDMKVINWLVNNGECIEMETNGN